MLLSLHVENLAVIKKIDVDFTNGFMALTGETGAGKSIIIDSINLLLGSRADKEIIRTGESYAMVSGVFSGMNKTTCEALLDSGITPDEDGSILVQRTVSGDGRSTVKINGRTVTISVLRSITPYLVSIHGQSDTQDLTDTGKQLQMIDVFADNSDLLSEYYLAYQELEDIRRKIQEISEKENERERLLEILKYQIDDIDSYALQSDEEESLIERKLKIKNREKITKNALFAFKALKGSEKGSVSFLLDRSSTALSQISDMIPKFQEYSEVLRELLYQIDDIAEEVYASVSDMEDDTEETLNAIESRLDKISKLKRKYGFTVKDILEFRENAFKEFETLSNAENLLNELEKNEKTAYEKAVSLANSLHERRCMAAKSVEAEIKNTLEFLDMPKVVFFASIEERFENGRKILHPTGSDEVEFYISANKGVDAQPLAKIASGGELARVMLAIKGVMADKDGTSTVIFDEIDAGVSGKTARKIGVKMLSLSQKMQLFCVTHSAQIASLADTHYLISKSEKNGSTETSVRTLDRDGRITELSRILGGIDVTEAQRRAAIDMLDKREL